MSAAPSDWEQGVLAAAKWLRQHGHVGIAEEMLRTLAADTEGTEVRVVKQIAAYVKEWGISIHTTVGERIDIDLLALAENIERGEWRAK